ncbi:GNAT family N-acetyltransferase [Cytophagales bacterium LB-30]|uniref:GNAT family N-acetyltransferase n=1 Tax=Shiella aurantiaca TaxID=3058365 RepID=A0ABT8F912_9BACT|nr:GNAT family N-acetyltransferase [Shiella aurantiaca]MDN4166922.1 GNAT family N-acetyltransferase [Shiella aurantiaca]
MHLYRHSDWYAFSEEIPSGYSSQLPDFLYYHPAHLQSKNLSLFQSFFILSIPNKLCLAQISFVRKWEEAHSLPMSSYAGLIGTESIAKDVLTDFFLWIRQSLASKGVKKLHWVQTPAVLGGLTFEVPELAELKEHIKIGHYLPIDANDFSEKVHTMQKRKLKRAHQEGWKIHQAPVEQAEEVFELLEKWRMSSEKPLSLTKQDFMQQVQAAPEAYGFWLIEKQGHYVAGTISVRISQDVLYHFYPATAPEAKTESPMVFLTESLYDHAQAKGYRVIDLGTSEVNNAILPSLVQFKERIGGQVYHKSVLDWEL